MKSVYRNVLAVMCFIFVSLSSFSPANAATKDGVPKTKISDEVTVATYTKENRGATISCIDPNLQYPTNNLITPYGTINEVYDHTEYTYNYSSITAYDVGPGNNDKFLLSVARGGTDSLKKDVDVSGTLTISGSVEAKVQELIKIGLTSTASGTLKFTWSTTKVFVGPEAPYNSRSYYAAINYDQYTSYLTKTDYYKQYNGTTYTGMVGYSSQITVTGVKKPKGVEYSVDSIQ